MMSDKRNFECPETGHRCDEGGCTMTRCVRREREDYIFLRARAEKARVAWSRPPSFVDLGDL
jgi:hypothetical protein